MKKHKSLKTIVREVCLPDLKKKGHYFSSSTLRTYLDGKGIPWTAATLNRYMVELLEGGFTFDAGRGWYSSLAERFVLDATPVQELIEMLKKRFPLLNFTCWSTRQISSYGHHLLAKFVTFVYAERDAMESVYDFLDDAGYDAQLNPRGKSAVKFAIRDRTVVVRPKVTRQPADQHIIPIEGLLVELFVESRSLSLLDEGEYLNIFRNVTSQGRVSMAMLVDYTRERRPVAMDLLKSINPEYSQNSGLIDRRGVND